MNDNVLKEYELYEKEYNDSLAQVTVLYNSMWSTILEEYYKDKYSGFTKEGKYFVDFPEDKVLRSISPYAGKLLIKLLVDDGFVYGINGLIYQWSITRNKIDKLIQTYREEKNKTTGSK